MPEQVHCPKCNGKQPKKRTSDAYYWCDRCKGMFDDDKRPGADSGDYSDRDPSARLEREERRKTQVHQYKRR